MTYEYDLSQLTPPPSPPCFKHKHALPSHRRPSSKQSSAGYDISRILDPAYASASSSSASSSSPSSAYVDRHGDLHDPDFRPFAPAHKRRSAPGAGINVDTYRTQWDGTSDDEDDAASACGSETERLHHPHYPHAHHHHHLSQRDRSTSGSRTRTTSPRRFLPYYEPPFAATTLSSSPEEDDATVSPYLRQNYHYDDYNVRIRRADEEEDPFVDAYGSGHATGFGYDEEGERKGRRLLKGRMAARKEKRKSKDEKDIEKRVVPHAPSPFQLDGTTVEDEVSSSQQQEWTPTCTQSIRRQWQAVSLALRFSLFRARRRLRRKLLNK
ncbi:hypothetical protein GLOTRDRAFT_114455 [Gloeophyllum trabeum ATCC 11539]|uniref:Uncharacterized protein n=1 Tax=Gloeophyllum trabeum (strain ATCC 11539 / FP-39264 / Madison 617) TaxID=670483 RepID=S7QEI1_GLOTA|nr:uncharacterized protein GLOTRDRAFT_114455 [Gloeophyllum trabeum ATCC 11539]EPQ57842.1 hypothetical protein GLOTRDRAFT_114455 [Gloeophyllum trabeum ATCC 11539]